ncbi:MAG: AgmX/PglI C-terminal domain-containing protein [Deltaproteobacteria bacterium]|nr:AgmX/PglI C-terminal domain-containing protein [Deltaproteobacteria bacterium]
MNRTITWGLLAAISMHVCASTGCTSGNDSQARVRSAVEAQHDALSACYADALEYDAELDGDLQVALTVDEEGNVDDVAVDGATIGDEEMPVCVAMALSNMRLRRPPAAKARIAYTLRFTPAN